MPLHSGLVSEITAEDLSLALAVSLINTVFGPRNFSFSHGPLVQQDCVCKGYGCTRNDHKQCVIPSTKVECSGAQEVTVYC